MTKEIAVLLPVYMNDDANFLRQAVESIIFQTRKDFVILIGVDGPVTETVENYLKLLNEHSDINVTWFKENRGLACVLNDLITIAKTKKCTYYARMDADDVAETKRFELQTAFLDNHPDVDVVGGAIEEIDGNGKLKGKRVEYPLTHEECRRFFRYRDPLAHPAVMFRARYFGKVPSGYRNEYRKNQDTMLWFDGFMNGCVFANLSDIVLNFRVTDDFYKSRRNGWARAKKMLKDRLVMNKALNYDMSANLFAVAMFCMTVSPSWVKKLLYKIR